MTKGCPRVSKEDREPGQGWRDPWGSRELREGQEEALAKLRKALEKGQSEQPKDALKRMPWGLWQV